MALSGDAENSIASILTHRTAIESVLGRFFSEKREELSRVNPLAATACDRLQQFVSGGKMIRGCLVALGHSAREPGAAVSAAPAAVEAGAALELFQSGLLIHDDIMDRDLVRRGRATLFEQYGQDALGQGVSDWKHVGEALGICVGDVAFFLAYELLGQLEASPPALARVIALFSRELAAVGIAQMQDVWWGAGSQSDPGEPQVVQMYRYKTGRYTFSLPLAVGATLAGAPPQTVQALESIGERMGILFQIRDDELSLFGDERQTGKPVGSDVKEGKRTLLYTRLMAACRSQERARLSGIFGNPSVTERELEQVRSLAESRGVRASIRDTVRRLEEEARATIRTLACGAQVLHALESLLEFTTARES